MTLHPQTRKALQQDGRDVKQALSRRDARIVRAVTKYGASLREVAVAVGLSHTAVANIVNRQTK